MSKKENAALARCMLYSLDCPAGQVFTGVDAIEKAIDDGWKDTPPPAELLAKAEKSAADDQANAELQQANADLQAAIQRAENAEAALAAMEKRATAAETKLAAAEKKVAKGASK